MNTRSTFAAVIGPVIGAVIGAAALTLVAPAAQAASVDRFDRSNFDSTPVVTASGYELEGATAGELGGYLSLSVHASDGSVPVAGECETADVHAVLTVAPGETFTINTKGELCGHFIDGTPTLNAYFGAKQVDYAGSHKKARVSNGMIGFTKSFLGAQGSVGLTVRW
jgi:hypothetical protein